MADEEDFIPSPTLTDDQITRILQAANESVAIGSGAGSRYSLYRKNLARFDKLGYNILPPNQELTGFTFITRPHLNLATSNIRHNPYLYFMDTFDETSYGFSIRCWLDHEFEKGFRNRDLPYNNPNSPFIIPLSNNMIGSSGWPDYRLATETTEGGYFSEDLTFVVGSDRNYTTTDITVNFRDIMGGYVSTMLAAWLQTMDSVAVGEMAAYIDDIDDNRLEYTVSIYRLITDVTKRRLTHWFKATGCFPVAHPQGEIANYSQDSYFVEGLREFSVQFVANHVSQMNHPAVLTDFNRLVRRYCPSADPELGLMADASILPETNFMGIPYINLKDGKNTLMWMVDPSQESLVDPLKEVMQEYGLNA